MTDDEIRKQIESSEQAIEMADRAIRRIDLTLRESRERMKKIRADLRRAGLLR